MGRLISFGKEKSSKCAVSENDFLWLQQWYQLQSIGKPEEEQLIHISTLDNPGWSLIVNLKNSAFENIIFNPIKIDRSENDWMYASIKNQKFEAYCGPNNFFEILKFFRSVIEEANKVEI